MDEDTQLADPSLENMEKLLKQQHALGLEEIIKNYMNHQQIGETLSTKKDNSTMPSKGNEQSTVKGQTNLLQSNEQEPLI